MLAGITAVWPKVPATIALLRSLSFELFPSSDVATAIAGGLTQSVMIGLIAAAFLLVAPLAIYFALADD